MSEPLTEAEQVAFGEMLRHGSPAECWCGENPCDECSAAARAVVAALRPLIEADALDSFADAATVYGPASADHIRLAAFMVRKGRTTVRAWLDSDDAHSAPREN